MYVCTYVCVCIYIYMYTHTCDAPRAGGRVHLRPARHEEADDFLRRYGMVWYGMVWYGMVWNGMVWIGVDWCGVVWYNSISIG